MSAERKDISVRQQNILNALSQVLPNQPGLTYDELREAVDLKSLDTVSYHLRVLTRRGLITPTQAKHRLTYITDAGREFIEPQVSEES